MICTTLLIQEGKPVLFSLHLFRLERQAEFLNISAPANLRQVILAYLQTAQENEFALRVDVSMEGRVHFTTRAIPERLGKIGLCERASFTQIPWIKYAEREAWNKEKRKLGVQHLLFHQGDEILEFSEGNVFLWYQDRLFTPPFEGNFLAGTARAAVLFIAQVLELPVIEKRCQLSWLEAGASLYFSSSLRGIKPIDDNDVEIISKIQGYFEDWDWLEKHENEILQIFQDSFPDMS